VRKGDVATYNDKAQGTWARCISNEKSVCERKPMSVTKANMIWASLPCAGGGHLGGYKAGYPHRAEVVTLILFVAEEALTVSADVKFRKPSD